MLVLVKDAGTHHLGQACGAQLLSAHLCHTPLLKMHGLQACKKEINTFLLEYGKCLFCG